MQEQSELIVHELKTNSPIYINSPTSFLKSDELNSCNLVTDEVLGKNAPEKEILFTSKKKRKSGIPVPKKINKPKELDPMGTNKILRSKYVIITEGKLSKRDENLELRVKYNDGTRTYTKRCTKVVKPRKSKEN